MNRIALILATAALTAAGCGSGDGGTTISEPRVPGPTDTLVVYKRTGGIAGVQERLYVRPDGAARIEVGGFKPKATRFRLDPAELSRLRDARDAVDFAKLKPRYGDAYRVADGFETTVAADGRTVTVYTLGEPPPELDQLIAVCGEIVKAHAPPP